MGDNQRNRIHRRKSSIKQKQQMLRRTEHSVDIRFHQSMPQARGRIFRSCRYAKRMEKKEQME
jgi:hypothetical protein